MKKEFKKAVYKIKLRNIPAGELINNEDETQDENLKRLKRV